MSEHQSRVSSHIALLGVLLLASGCGARVQNEKELAFLELFPSKPPSIELIAYDRQQGFMSGGSYVLLFKASRADLLDLMAKADYQQVNIDSEPGTWRLSLCNDTIEKVSSQNVRIDESFECFSKSGSTNRASLTFSTGERIRRFSRLNLRIS